MNDWFETLEGLHRQVWQRLASGVADRDAPARQPTLATVSPDGWPEARTVVLRHASQDQAMVEIYTDLHSCKVTSLRATPRAALHVWDPALCLQLRLQAEVDLATGNVVADRWHPLTEVGRESYGITPSPASPIVGALDYVKSPEQSHFCVMTLKLTQMDIVHLGDHHRRAVFARDDGWQGQWVAP